MNTIPSRALGRYLSHKPGSGRFLNPTIYITAGAALANPVDLAGLRRLLPQVRKKTAAITDSDRLRRRLEVLTRFFEETAPEPAPAESREVAFVLYYFLKGYDLIPDMVPDVGLVDDALLIDNVLQRNLHALQTHWAACGRTWPTDL